MVFAQFDQGLTRSLTEEIDKTEKALWAVLSWPSLLAYYIMTISSGFILNIANRSAYFERKVARKCWKVSHTFHAIETLVWWIVIKEMEECMCVCGGGWGGGGRGWWNWEGETVYDFLFAFRVEYKWRLLCNQEKASSNSVCRIQMKFTMYSGKASNNRYIEYKWS